MWFIFSARAIKPATPAELQWSDYFNTANAAMLLSTFLACYLVRRARKWFLNRRAQVINGQAEERTPVAARTPFHPGAELPEIREDRPKRSDPIMEEDTDDEDDSYEERPRRSYVRTRSVHH